MANYVPNYRYDVFLSYAHVDDMVLDQPPGWVTTFWKHLKARLTQRIGRADDYEIWMDHDLEYSDGITPQILRILEQSAVLLVVLSPGYARSAWCERERGAFLDSMAERSGQRIIVVERERFEDLDSPLQAMLPDIKRFEFSVEDDTGRRRILGPPARLEQTYWDLIDDVSAELVTAMRRLRDEQQREPGGDRQDTGERTDAVATVYLAHVNHDLEELRFAVKRHLEQHDIEVLPTGHYVNEPQAFRAAAERDLLRSTLCVQLLGEKPWKEPADVAGGYYRVQQELAATAGIPTLQWRSPDLDLDEITDADHLDIVDSASVRAEPIGDFKQEVIDRVTGSAAQEKNLPEVTRIFLCAEPRNEKDRMIAEDLSAELSDMGVDCIVPVDSDDPGEYRKELESSLQRCDGMIVVFGDSPPTWVRQQLKQCRRARLRRQSRIDWAVYKAAPEAEAEKFEDFKGLTLLPGGGEFDEAALTAFIDGLRS